MSPNLKALTLNPLNIVSIMNDKPTPETDAAYKNHAWDMHDHIPLDFARKLERERNEWKKKYIQQNKDLGCEQMDPNGTIWDYAKKLERERDRLAEALNGIVACSFNCENALDEAEKMEWIAEQALATLNQQEP